MSDFDGAAYLAARAGAARSLREIEQEAAELGLRSLAALAGRQAEQFERPTPFTAAVEQGIQACWCEPMEDSSDPEQHRVGCLGAEVIRIDRRRAETRWEWRPLAVSGGQSWSPSAIPSSCYVASFGRVHVRPGCRCAR